MKTYSFIIADDHPLFRNGVKDVLRELPWLHSAGEAGDGASAYQLILSERPDIAILDLEMPLLTGIDVCAKVKSEKHHTHFIILTMHREKHFFDAAMNAGADGYLLKDNAVQDLLQCITEVCKGQKYISKDIGHYLVEHDDQLARPEVIQVKKMLSPTEKVILKLISEGKSSAEIAGLLFISANTVDNHRANMSRKLGLEGKNSLMKFAMQHKGYW